VECPRIGERNTQVAGFHRLKGVDAYLSWVLVQFRRCAAKKLVTIEAACCKIPSREAKTNPYAVGQ
jgi:hypothetical protein